MRQHREMALRACPFERVETTGERALETWEGLRTAGRGAPVVVGDEDSLADLMSRLLPPVSPTSATDIIDIASRLRHPADLAARRASDLEAALKLLNKKPNLGFAVRDSAPEVGEWPTKASPMPGLTVALESIGSAPLAKVQICLIPTDDWTTVPAHLQWGGANECPYPEYQVAAFRSWRDRFGAELAGMNGDTVNLRVRRRPGTRSEALELAREQYLYCNDIVDQGTGTLSELAASLMESDWWFFWWD
jgi:hypothetical protein